MSKQTWAKIVYGRSYYLDFRFITIPHDFTADEIAWVSPYILATTQKARNLKSHPRWTLFKNDSHCVVGVTCMVRDLIGMTEDAIEAMTNDDLGRPLYVFVGFVTRLNRDKILSDFPAYTQTHLNSFEPLYQDVEKVWLVKDYHNRQPLLSEYKPLHTSIDTTDGSSFVSRIPQLNDRTRYPHKTFVWQRSKEQNNHLWLASAVCSQSTSVCLNINGKYLVNSPFLNQTTTNIEQFRVCDRIINNSLSNEPQAKPKLVKPSSLQQKISTKAKADIDLTLQQAAKVTLASQEIINSFTNKSDRFDGDELEPETPEENESFGFKVKKTATPDQKEKNWF